MPWTEIDSHQSSRQAAVRMVAAGCRGGCIAEKEEELVDQGVVVLHMVGDLAAEVEEETEVAAGVEVRHYSLGLDHAYRHSPLVLVEDIRSPADGLGERAACNPSSGMTWSTSGRAVVPWTERSLSAIGLAEEQHQRCLKRQHLSDERWAGRNSASDQNHIHDLVVSDIEPLDFLLHDLLFLFSDIRHATRVGRPCAANQGRCCVRRFRGRSLLKARATPKASMDAEDVPAVNSRKDLQGMRRYRSSVAKRL